MLARVQLAYMRTETAQLKQRIYLTYACTLTSIKRMNMETRHMLFLRHV